jgi:catechol 2,3-dioxygenase-like lactoylglutathione lyase family enzyme
VPSLTPRSRTRPRKEFHDAAGELTAGQAGLIAVGGPTTGKELDKALAGAAKVVKRGVEATTDEITSELQEALKEADMVDMHLEVDIIPVSDVDRAKQFYQRLGWRLDQDAAPLEGLRIVQFTPPGSAASVTFGQGLTAAAPGSAEGGLIVSDIVAAHDELAGRGIDTSEIWHGPPFPVEARQPGPDPERTSYGSFCSFADPDGNTWLVQEVTTRLPGRV